MYLLIILSQITVRVKMIKPKKIAHLRNENFLSNSTISNKPRNTDMLHQVSYYTYVFFFFFLLYKVEKPSVRLSVHLHFTHHADNSVMCASLKTRLARNNCYVFWHQRVCFLKFPGAIVFRQRSVEGTYVGHYQKSRWICNKIFGPAA